MPFKSFYVQSRGVSHNYDYQWKKITPDEQQQDDAKFILPLNEFLDTEYEPFSLLIARTEEGLCLLITGLQSNRKDFQNRVIRNSLAFIFDEDKEQELRGIAVRFLEDEKSIRKKLEQIITDDEKLGFRVKYDDFCELFSDKVNGIGDGQPKNECLIGNTSTLLLSDLAETLRKTKLPQQQEKLVVVTGIKSPEKLAKVWRALCSLEKSTGWRTSATQKKMPRKTPIAALIVLALAGIFSLMFIDLENNTNLENEPSTLENKLENKPSPQSNTPVPNSSEVETTKPDNGSTDKEGQESHPSDIDKPPHGKNENGSTQGEEIDDNRSQAEDNKENDDSKPSPTDEPLAVTSDSVKTENGSTQGEEIDDKQSENSDNRSQAEDNKKNDDSKPSPTDEPLASVGSMPSPLRATTRDCPYKGAHFMFPRRKLLPRKAILYGCPVSVGCVPRTVLMSQFRRRNLNGGRSITMVPGEMVRRTHPTLAN